MKQKVSDFVADFLAQNEIKDVFTVVGGGAMHLNDSFGHNPNLKCTYFHHEQACSIAAESYARIHNKIATVCVTTGPGGTNAITGVVGGYLDSIPMLIISGQVRYDTTVRSTGLNLRALGDQEFDICKAVDSMTKYCEMVIDPNKIRYCLEKALYIAKSGRPGPCWLDIPLNVQSSYIETDELESYNIDEYQKELPIEIADKVFDEIIEKIKNAKRPILYAGNGIRISGGYENFKTLIRKLNIPVVTAWNSIDQIEDEDILYVGRAGIMGDRAGNFAVQNSDLVLSIGCRLSIRQVGYNWSTWAREAYTIVVDIDHEELKKPTVRVDLPIWMDAKKFMNKLNSKLESPINTKNNWVRICNNWKSKYPVVKPEHYENSSQEANVYAFIKELSDSLNEGQITVVGNGSACVVGSHAYTIKRGQRFIINSAIASMGYDLPAAIGACIADSSQDIICISGDGSIQMNLQELQTIIHHKLPIKIFIINNNGYHSIRQTQKNFFGEPLIGIGNDSGDLSFPDMSKLAVAYGYPYVKISNNIELKEKIRNVLAKREPVICEVFVSTTQKFEPKCASRKLEDGTMVSSPLEDLAPFLSREELKENMIIPLIDSSK